MKERISHALASAALALLIAIGFAIAAVLAFSLVGVLLYTVLN